MHIHRRKNLDQKADHFETINVEIFAAEKSRTYAMSRRYVIDYIRSTAKELAELALNADNTLLAYLLGMVAQQAEDEYQSSGPQLLLVKR